MHGKGLAHVGEVGRIPETLTGHGVVSTVEAGPVSPEGRVVLQLTQPLELGVEQEPGNS